MKSSLIDNRQIRIFISSTFRDMQDEREFLMTRTFPRLRLLAAERDVTLTELDLRWGITQEESETGKVVEICLSEIENSIPFFIGIIGGRYGWIPKEGDIDKRITGRFESVTDYLAKRLSVTEMEMQFGVLERQDNMHAYFYIRNGSTVEDDEPEKLAALKDAVIRNRRYPVEYYDSPDGLSAQVEQDFTKLLDELFPIKHLSELEKERIGQRSFLHQLCQNYIRNEDYFERIEEWKNNWESHYLVISGESGQGKSAFVANWIEQELESESRDYKIIYHFIGNGGSLGDKDHLIRILINEIEDQFGFSVSEGLSPEDSLAQMLARVSNSGEKLLIALDAVNQLSDVDNAKQIRWLPEAGRNIKILFSTLPEDKTMRIFESRKYRVMLLRPLDMEQKSAFITKYLFAYGKKLSENPLRRIAEARVTDNCLVLTTLLEELIRFGNYETLNETIDYYLGANDIIRFYNRLLNRYEQDLDFPGGILLMHLAVSRFGLKETEIIQLTKYSTLQWSEFYSLFKHHFVNKNGLITFGHEYLRKVVNQRYLATMPDAERNIRLNISTHLESDFNRNCEEIPYQDYFLKNYDALYRFLLRPDVFHQCYSTDEMQLAVYWRALAGHGYYITDFMDKCREMGSFRFAHELSRFCSKYLHAPEAALLFAKEAQRINETKTSQDADDKYQVYEDLAASYSDAGDYENAITNRKEAISEIRKLKGYDKSDLAYLYCGLGEDYFGNHEYAKAIKYTKMALRIWTSESRYIEIREGLCYNNLGVIHGRLRHYDEELLYSKKALKIRRAVFGDHYDPTITSYLNTGLAYSHLSQSKLALRYYRKALRLALDMARTTFTEDSTTLISIYWNIGIEYSDSGNHKRACAWFRKALSSHIRIYGINHLDTDRFLRAIISEYELLDDKRSNLKYHTMRLEYVLKNEGLESETLPYLYNNIGVLHRQLGHKNAAIKYSLMAITASDKILGPCLDTGIAYDRMGAAYQAAGNKKKAEAAYEQAISLFDEYDKSGKYARASRKRLRSVKNRHLS